MNWGQKAKWILQRLETQIRCLVGDLRFIDLTERTDKILAPYMRSHRASRQNLNIFFIEELNRVVVMIHDPQCVLLVDSSGRTEIVRQLSERQLEITSNHPIGQMRVPLTEQETE